MANTDSFIEEVTEEVRRDRLFGLFRRWAWLAVLIVLGIVGAAGWLEYSRAQERAAAQAFGDAVLAALEEPDAAARIAALGAIGGEGPEARVLVALLAAGEAATSGEGAEQAAADLRRAAEAPELPRRYRDLAMLKAEIIGPSGPDAARLILGALAEPGAPYAALAEEQLALLDLRSGDVAAAIERLRGLERSAAATPGLQERASQLIVALEAGSTLIDTAPTPEPVPEPAPEPAPAEAAPQGQAAPVADAAPEAGQDTGNAEDAAGQTAPAVQQ